MLTNWGCGIWQNELLLLTLWSFVYRAGLLLTERRVDG